MVQSIDLFHKECVCFVHKVKSPHCTHTHTHRGNGICCTKPRQSCSYVGVNSQFTAVYSNKRTVSGQGAQKTPSCLKRHESKCLLIYSMIHALGIQTHKYNWASFSTALKHRATSFIEGNLIIESEHSQTLKFALEGVQQFKGHFHEDN